MHYVNNNIGNISVNIEIVSMATVNFNSLITSTVCFKASIPRTVYFLTIVYYMLTFYPILNLKYCDHKHLTFAT